jgi:hypothetical protein
MYIVTRPHGLFRIAAPFFSPLPIFKALSRTPSSHLHLHLLPRHLGLLEIDLVLVVLLIQLVILVVVQATIGAPAEEVLNRLWQEVIVENCAELNGRKHMYQHQS